ncbi:MAG: VWA domain-containing protein [Acidobacteriota bacterium]
MKTAMAVSWIALACAVVVASGVAGAAPQQPTFHSGVDVIAVDVQVIDKDGFPVADLTPDKFHVTVDGRPRQVVSATLVGTALKREMASGKGRTGTATVRRPAVAAPDEILQEMPPIVLAFDCLSFSPAAEFRVVQLARDFVSQLDPAQRVGLLAYPIGPKLDPTTDHRSVADAIGQVLGQKGSTQLLPSQIVDGSIAPCPVCPPLGDPFMQAQELEAQGRTQLGIFEELMRNLGTVKGRKVVVLVSAGMVVADRIGFRPDLGEYGMRVGKVAAEANVTVYSLFIDKSLFAQMSADRRSAMPREQPIARDGNILGRMIDQVSGASGGEMFRSLTDDGAYAFDRLLRETSASVSKLPNAIATARRMS